MQAMSKYSAASGPLVQDQRELEHYALPQLQEALQLWTKPKWQTPDAARRQLRKVKNWHKATNNVNIHRSEMKASLLQELSHYKFDEYIAQLAFGEEQLKLCRIMIDTWQDKSSLAYSLI